MPSGRLIECAGLFKFKSTKVFMAIADLVKTKLMISRRVFLRAVMGLIGVAASAGDVATNTYAWAQAGLSGLPLPDEAVDATLKRLFGNRSFQRGDDKIKVELPQIAEDGGNVAITIDSSLPVSGAAHVNHIYIISDKNRRPMIAKFSFTPESGKALVATQIRLATSTDVRAIAEMNDGTLYAVSKPVRVTISGCDLPPQG
jgi:predicted secreted protein